MDPTRRLARISVRPPACQEPNRTSRTSSAELARPARRVAGESVWAATSSESRPGGELDDRSKESRDPSRPTKQRGGRRVAELVVGDFVADRYRIVRALAHGGMARVYFAEDVRLERPVVVKYGVGVEAPYLRREARVLANLDDVLIPPVFDVGDVGAEGAFLVMPWIPADNLRDVIATTGPWSALAAAELGLALARAVAHVHARGIVHCDLKPSNVLVRDDPARRIALVDFGVADNVEPPITRLARTGKILGTPCFLPPENLRGGVPTQRTDVYGLGACLYYALSGVPPVEPREQLAELLVAVMEGRVVPLRARRPGMPAELAELVHRALSPDPDARFADAIELAEALRKVHHRLRLTHGSGIVASR